MSDFNVINLREKNCVETQNNDQFLQFLIEKIDCDSRVNNIYQKIIPIIQKINKKQTKINSFDPVFEKNNIKDILSCIKKEQDQIQLIITKLLINILNEINYTDK